MVLEVYLFVLFHSKVDFFKPDICNITDYRRILLGAKEIVNLPLIYITAKLNKDVVGKIM